MRLGLCCSPEEADAALAMGYDYVELPASATIPSETTNLFFPSGAKIYLQPLVPSPDAFDLGKELIDAASGRGVEVMVVGSGAVRRSPDEKWRFEYESGFYMLVKLLDEYADRYGIRIAPESLNPEETDVATSLPEMARALDARGVGFTADSYHALVETGTPDEEADLEFWRAQVPFAPLHVHFAPYERSIPTGDEPSLRWFFARLRETGYDGRASLECLRDGIPDPAPLRRLFDVE